MWLIPCKWAGTFFAFSTLACGDVDTMIAMHMCSHLTMLFTQFPALRQLFFQDWKTLGLCSPYLKCLMSGLRKLKRRPAIVWRGTIGDVRKHYVVGKKIFWWHFNPCTTSMQSLNTDTFLGRRGKRTIFNVRTGLS